MTMANGRRWFWIGSRAAVRDAVAAALGEQPTTASPEDVSSGDLVVADLLADASVCAALPSGYVLGAVRAWKDVPGVAAYVVVAHDDRIGAQLARVAGADGVLRLQADGRVDGRDLAPPAPTRRAPVDELLARLEPRLQQAGPDSPLQRLLRFEHEDSLAQRLQDAETGLFDGPYAALKLDEEWKRAHRFRQPLSLLLLDLGPKVAQLGDTERRLVFAEAAGVFLNECRDIDVLARFAPTVFLFLLPGTAPDGAEVLAKRIVASLQQRFAGRSDVGPVCGVCSVPSNDVPDRRAFLVLAEACLERARQAGAGAVCPSWQ
jgi:GGDEF domain-containing protein